MLDANENIVSVRDLLDRGETSNIIVMKLTLTPHFCSNDGIITVKVLESYNQQIDSGGISNYVGDAESIFRLGIPLGASTLKKIFGAAGMAGEYEHLATYEETVGGLDQIRAIAGILDEPAMCKVLVSAGLDHIPNPGYMLNGPVLGFTTKFDPSGDKDLTWAEAQAALRLDALRFRAFRATLEQNALHQRAFCDKAGVVNIDGKLEAAIIGGYPVLTDFACTVDENRLMLRYQPDKSGPPYLIPTNKEIQRAIFRARGIYAAKEEATNVYGDQWAEHLLEFTTTDAITEATRESVWMMEQAIGEIANRLLSQTIFQAQPMESWVGPFLPYASIEQ